MIITIIICIAFWLLNISGYGYYTGCPFDCRLLYCFEHAGFLHLLLNCIAIRAWYEHLRLSLSYNRIEIRTSYSLLYELSMYLCGFLATFGTAFDTPTVGASGIAFAMAGFSCALGNFQRFLYIAAPVIICNCIMCIFGHFNTNLHFIAMIYGAVLGFLFSSKCYRFRKY